MKNGSYEDQIVMPLMKRYLVAGALGALIIALMTIFAPTYAENTFAAVQPPDFKFLKTTMLTFTINKACADTLAPCDTVTLTAPFTCVDCGMDFKHTFAAAGNAVTVGFVAPGGQCPAILNIPQEPTTGTTYSVDFGALNVFVPLRTKLETLYEGAAVLPISGANGFAAAIIYIYGKVGTLILTGSGNFSRILNTKPVSVFIIDTEPKPKDKGDRANPEIACVDVAKPLYVLTPAAATTTSLSSSLNPSTFGQAITFTATVSSMKPGTRTGTVTFFDGATPLTAPPITLNASGQAIFTTSSLAVGSHSITAVYSGDANFESSTSPALMETIHKAGTSTTLSLSCTLPSTGTCTAPSGSSLTFTATVVPTSGSMPMGTVTFCDTPPTDTTCVDATKICKDAAPSCKGATQIGKDIVIDKGQAILVTTLADGCHCIGAVYSGDPNFTGSTSNSVLELGLSPIR